MTTLHSFEQVLAGKRIMVSGHTGFTGSWTCLWLSTIGATVGGYALAPDTTPSLYRILELDSILDSEIGDIGDYARLSAFVSRFQPELILHLAAQPLVQTSYREPLSTFAINILGTAHLLEAARQLPTVRGIVCVTSDKVYQNTEWPRAFRETDSLGGKDPYSASKAGADIVIDSYRASFGKVDGSGLAIATARGGNIIGGGDWSEDRLIPDFVRAVVNDADMTLRYPDATRPWQHVLALVQAYLMLMAGLLASPQKYARSWNFGPHDTRPYPVREVLEILSTHWQRPRLTQRTERRPEVLALALDSSLARQLLAWLPPWNTHKAIEETAAWYRQYYACPASAPAMTRAQLQAWRGAMANTA